MPAVPSPAVVVLVEDDPAVLNALTFSLELEGFSVLPFSSGRAILDHPAASLPSRGCLVLDYVLPDMNALDLLRELRARGSELPAILITTHPSAALRRRAEALGIGIVEKPLLNDKLLEHIRRATDAAR